MKLSKMVVSVVILGALIGGNAMAVLIEDFENVSDWGAGGARGAYCSVSASSEQAQVGSFAGQFFYSLSEAQGNDYVDFYNDRLSLNLTGQTAINFKALMPNDPDMFVQLQMYSATGGFLEYNFGEGNGVWTDFSLALSSFTDYGTNPNLANINLIRFRLNGDASAVATSGNLYVDQMESIPEPATICLLAIGAGLFCRRQK